MAAAFDGLVRAQLTLALLGNAGKSKRLAVLIREARRAGLAGAEIDIALTGSSFEAGTVAVITFARALKSSIDAEITRACAVGMSDADLQAVAAEAAQILGRSLS